MAARRPLSRIDRLIAWLSPLRGMQRAQARIAIEAILSYEGAKSSRYSANWLYGSTSADNEIAQFMGRMRDAARDLVRNNAHADKGVATIVGNKIGTGVLCSPAEIATAG